MKYEPKLTKFSGQHASTVLPYTCKYNEASIILDLDYQNVSLYFFPNFEQRKCKLCILFPQHRPVKIDCELV